jgi:hypothetical protein
MAAINIKMWILSITVTMHGTNCIQLVNGVFSHCLKSFTVLYCVWSLDTFTLAEVMKAKRGSSGIAPLFL